MAAGSAFQGKAKLGCRVHGFKHFLMVLITKGPDARILVLSDPNTVIECRAPDWSRAFMALDSWL